MGDVFALFCIVGTSTTVHRTFRWAMAVNEQFKHSAFQVRALYNDETALIGKQLTSLGLEKNRGVSPTRRLWQSGLQRCDAGAEEVKAHTVAESAMERNTVDLAKALKAQLCSQRRHCCHSAHANPLLFRPPASCRMPNQTLPDASTASADSPDAAASVA